MSKLTTHTGSTIPFRVITHTVETIWMYALVMIQEYCYVRYIHLQQLESTVCFLCPCSLRFIVIKKTAKLRAKIIWNWKKYMTIEYRKRIAFFFWLQNNIYKLKIVLPLLNTLILQNEPWPEYAWCLSKKGGIKKFGNSVLFNFFI